MAEKGSVNDLQWARPAHLTRPTVGLDELLQGLALLGEESERATAAAGGWNDKTPPSMQVIKSGATAVTRWWSKWIAAVGGLAGAIPVVTGFFTTFIGDVGEAVTVALIAGGAVVFSATAIALALFVSGDLRARGHASAARQAARGVVTAAFLHATARLPAPGSPMVLAEPGPVTTPTGNPQAAYQFRLGDLIVRVDRKPG
ncbi:hypothetical protein [Virgisporangium aurantiacum]|uniref:Uncharacterized protein n=1 Tax=Virgisporangium aurantiacum TaxID=175570 RepID=A0A8J3Z5X0_9ACTN|nr:hypothetical protein [Virgisporangium aurantiacum]GIJ55505.1 hypothetical protein Vau01_030210 [Virgisporangium aurantiacum]